jgi:hypothetical protein
VGLEVGAEGEVERLLGAVAGRVPLAGNVRYVNYARPHKSLANPYPRTPAMAAGVADHIWTCEEIADLLD